MVLTAVLSGFVRKSRYIFCRQRYQAQVLLCGLFVAKVTAFREFGEGHSRQMHLFRACVEPDEFVGVEACRRIARTPSLEEMRYVWVYLCSCS